MMNQNAKKIIENHIPIFKNKGMGIPSLSEYEIWRTNEEEIRKVK
ncbi:Putative CutC family protein, partial [Candidatus Arthromitus sp. SFB-4]